MNKVLNNLFDGGFSPRVFFVSKNYTFEGKDTFNYSNMYASYDGEHIEFFNAPEADTTLVGVCDVSDIGAVVFTKNDHAEIWEVMDSKKNNIFKLTR